MSQLEAFIRALSRLLGWIYTFCWSASFYPQPIDNYRRKATTGLAIDFPTINVLGFVCYAVYTGTFLYSPVIRHQYAARHPLAPEPTVRFNDFAFALHAVVLSGLVYSQFWPSIWGFRVSRFQRVSKPIAGLFWGAFVAVAMVICVILVKSPDDGYEPLSWAWIDVIYTLSYVKLVITVVKMTGVVSPVILSSSSCRMSASFSICFSWCNIIFSTEMLKTRTRTMAQACTAPCYREVFQQVHEGQKTKLHPETTLDKFHDQCRARSGDLIGVNDT